MKKVNNKGFSLIELIVTIAIMAVVTGGAVSLYSYLSTAKVRQCYTGINDELGVTRTNAMSKKGKWSVVVKFDGNKYYAVSMKDGKEFDKTELGKKGDFKLTYMKLPDGAAAATEVEITDSASTWPTIMFNSGSGSCLVVDGYTVSEFKVSNPNLTKTVKLVKATGKHYVK